MAKENVIASACCCGMLCRWHGRRAPISKVLKEAVIQYNIIPVCPEMLGGLPCPRPPLKTKKGRVYETDTETRTKIGTERTDDLLRGSKKVLEIAEKNNCKKAYLFRLSPSCAVFGITGKFLRQESSIEVIPIW